MELGDLTWEQLIAECCAIADGAFMATVQTDGRPHVAWVGIGFGSETLWTATYRDSQKANNLRHRQHVALHWPERPDRLIFGRAQARLIGDLDEQRQLWDAGVLPYDQVAFYGTWDNPELLFVELAPTRFSVHNGDPTTPPQRWTRPS
jgi:general stress protein 26